jgi:hypothetical protein
MPSKQPQADEFGRLRVRENNTGHEMTINAIALPHGDFAVLDEAASSPAGDPLPIKYAAPAAAHESPVEATASGQQADTKEK